MLPAAAVLNLFVYEAICAKVVSAHAFVSSTVKYKVPPESFITVQQKKAVDKVRVEGWGWLVSTDMQCRH